MRPALRESLWRAREALAGAALVLLALWLGLGTFGITRWLAVALGLLGAGLAWTGLQRMRFAPGGGGPGVVEVTERRVVYWGPLTGGTVSLDDLLRLELDPGARPAHWILTPKAGEALAVPVDARGAEALLDLFTALPGLRTEALLAALARGQGAGRATLWRAPGTLGPPEGGPPRRLI